MNLAEIASSAGTDSDISDWSPYDVYRRGDCGGAGLSGCGGAGTAPDAGADRSPPPTPRRVTWLFTSLSTAPPSERGAPTVLHRSPTDLESVERVRGALLRHWPGVTVPRCDLGQMWAVEVVEVAGSGITSGRVGASHVQVHRSEQVLFDLETRPARRVPPAPAPLGSIREARKGPSRQGQPGPAAAPHSGTRAPRGDGAPARPLLRRVCAECPRDDAAARYAVSVTGVTTWHVTEGDAPPELGCGRRAGSSAADRAVGGEDRVVVQSGERILDMR